MTIFWRWPPRLLLVLAGVSLLPITANAGQSQSLESITQAAQAAAASRAGQHGYDNVAVEVRPLDKRLAMPRCEQPLTTHIPQASQILGAVSVGVACDGVKPWTLYVRTHLVAQRSIPVLARPLARNAVIREEDLKLIDQPLDSTHSGLVEDPDQIIGMELTRSLDSGAYLRINHLRPPKVIKRGQHVTLRTGVNGLEVRIDGKALGDAAAGERVAVTNLSTGKRVEGIAQAGGTVFVQ